jgi:hypothetical protein
MNPIPVNLAVEDEISETILRILITRLGRRYCIGTIYRRGGFGYLRRTIHGWNRAAKSCPFIVLTDLDDHACPQALIQQWLPVPKHPNLLFRVAVREVESWLLGDTVNLAQYLGCSPKIMPENPDMLADPKQYLIDIARKSRFFNIRASIVPRVHSTAKQGPNYNGCLAAFVTQKWDISAAMEKSPSLSRTVTRLHHFAPVWK